METVPAIGDTWERTSMSGRPPVLVTIIDRTKGEAGDWHVRVSLNGPVNNRWWIPEETLFRIYRRIYPPNEVTAA